MKSADVTLALAGKRQGRTSAAPPNAARRRRSL